MKVFETEFPGSRRFVLENEELSVAVIETGAAVQDIVYAGRHVALGYDNAEDYVKNDACIGAIVGRYANRIGNSRFTLNGKEYLLSSNEGKNQLHGGSVNLPWHKREWTGTIEGESLVMTLDSPAGDNGFPGNVTAKVTYHLEGSSLCIDFEGDTDEDTLFAPTTHIYFNLDGKSVLETEMVIASVSHLDVDEGLIPTGKVLPAEDAFDFTVMKKIGVSFDDCFITTDEHMLTAKAGGVQLDLYADFPAVQLYTGEHLEGKHNPFDGFAIEPELFPDSPNHPGFTNAVLKAGCHSHRRAVYTFSKCEE